MSKEAPKHTKADLEFLFKLYLQKRLGSQTKFYDSRVRENELNSNFTFTAATLVMTLSSLFATIGASDPGGSTRWLVFFSAVLPAFAALLAGFRQLYGWDRQVAIYRSAKLGLERAALIVPDNDLISESDIADVYPRLISSTEAVLTNEVNQWGQFLLDKEKQNEQQVDRVELIDDTTQREQVNAYSQTAEMRAAAAAESLPNTDTASQEGSRVTEMPAAGTNNAPEVSATSDNGTGAAADTSSTASSDTSTPAANTNGSAEPVAIPSDYEETSAG
jgi:hypothetical protein